MANFWGPALFAGARRQKMAPTRGRGQDEQGGFTSGRREDPKTLFPGGDARKPLPPSSRLNPTATMTAVRRKGHRKFARSRLQKLHPFSCHQGAKPNRASSVGWAMSSTDGSPMAEQILDRPAEAPRAASAVGNGLAPPAPALIPGWRCLPGAVIRAGGEEGPVDLAALHPAHGVALIAFLDEGQEASPEEAREALRSMLRDEGLQRRFPGELPIVALPVARAGRAQLAAAVDHAFAGVPAPTLPAGWVDWLAERLAAERPSAAPLMPPLVAPSRARPKPQKGG